MWCWYAVDSLCNPSPCPAPRLLAQFFQQNNDQNYNDMITFAMFMIAMYAIYQGFATVLKI